MAQLANQQVENYIRAFSDREIVEGDQAPEWLRGLRQKAMSRFRDTGFPTVRDEDWRFTNVSRIAGHQFVHGEQETVEPTSGELDIAAAVCKLVFINGHFVRELSTLDGLPDNVEANALSLQLLNHSESIKTHLGVYLDFERDAFCALNTGLFEDGAYVRIAPGVVVEGPLYCLYISAGSEATVSHPRNLVIVGEGAQASIVEEYATLSAVEHFCNSVTELVVGEDASVSHYRIERDSKAFNVSTLRIEQARSSNVATHAVLLGGELVRNNIHAVLAGEGAECLINGLFVGQDSQHLDNFIQVEHKAPHSNSRQFYNGILDDSSHGVFHGRIVVHKDAQKTDAKQTNRNLLLSDDAQIDSKPQLEIYADDVKCTHGATIGQIEQDALFYLRSRGIDEISARKLLLLAFANECLDRMADDVVKARVAGLIDSSMSQEGAGEVVSSR